jgi:hypothetical protein
VRRAWTGRDRIANAWPWLDRLGFFESALADRRGRIRYAKESTNSLFADAPNGARSSRAIIGKTLDRRRLDNLVHVSVSTASGESFTLAFFAERLDCYAQACLSSELATALREARQRIANYAIFDSGHQN